MTGVQTCALPILGNAEILNYQLDKFREVMEIYKNKREQKIVFIHGYESRGKLFSGSSRSTDEKIKYKQIIIGELGNRLSNL